MRLLLIRHGRTQGNREGRYIGTTDEPLCREGIEMLQSRAYPAAERVFVSPLLRCRETARLLYPEKEAQAVEDFRECDFGLFENKNYAELNGRADYQAWIDSGGEASFPGGESPEMFRARCVRAFEAVRPAFCAGTNALIVHGGTIMAIAAHLTGGAYFDFQVKNGEGYIWENGKLTPLFPKK